MYHNTPDHLQHEKYFVLHWEDGARQQDRKVSKDEYKEKKGWKPSAATQMGASVAQGLQGELEV